MHETLGVSYELFTYILLPLLIFGARVMDVTLSTVKIIFVMNGRRDVAPILGFFEALIWLVAIGQIISNIDNPVSYFAYAGGFATGTWVGMWVEEKLAVGRVVVRLFVDAPKPELMDFLHDADFRYSIMDAEGRMGKVSVLFLVLKRDQLPTLLQGFSVHHPQAFFTIEGVKRVSNAEAVTSKRQNRNLYARLRQRK